jgi:hypothetical protein
MSLMLRDLFRENTMVQRMNLRKFLFIDSFFEKESRHPGSREDARNLTAADRPRDRAKDGVSDTCPEQGLIDTYAKLSI